MAEKTCERCEHFEPNLRGCWRGERNVRDASGKPRLVLPSVQPALREAAQWEKRAARAAEGR